MVNRKKQKTDNRFITLNYSKKYANLIINMKDKIFFNNLDALRFFAFFLVFLAHAPIKTGLSFIDSSLNSFGAYGVYLFFVISGFLITYLLFVENRKFNQINLSSFFVLFW